MLCYDELPVFCHHFMHNGEQQALEEGLNKNAFFSEKTIKTQIPYMIQMLDYYDLPDG